MGFSLLRYQTQTGPEWGVLHGDEVVRLGAAPATLAGLLQSDWRERIRGVRPSLRLEDLRLLPPVTAPCQIVCQGKNYLDHIVETGVRPEDKNFNLLFTKADSALAPPSGRVARPGRVQLLDYELELGLVIGKAVTADARITEENLHEYVAGFVMANDLSARDVQIPERQWFKGKSFRGFCPVGPVLFVPEAADFPFLYELELELKVNGKVRQKAKTGQLIHRPAETLAEIATIFDLRPGDLLLTGTPGGVAMRVKPRRWWEELAAALRSDARKFAEFVAEQKRSGRYLQPGDRIESTIQSPNGRVNLGQQSLLVT